MPLNIRPILRGIAYALIVALILSVVVGALTAFTGMPESELINGGVFVISVFIGGAAAAKISGAKGLYYGIAVGLGVVAVIVLISAVLLPSPFSWLGVLQKIFNAVLAGAIGGAVGVALK